MVRKNIILIIKEALNNVAKYSDASKVGILLTNIGDNVLLEMKDDGKGFDKETALKGNGLENMAARCSQMGGTFDIKSKPGEGTTLTCMVPIAIISYNGSE
jgi:signal transduction histidine kinase